MTPLGPLERRAALDAELLPDPDALGVELEELAELRAEHAAAVAKATDACAAMDYLDREYRLTTGARSPIPGQHQPLDEARAQADAALQAVANVLDEVRALLPDWRAAVAAVRAPRREEAEQLRARLAELETEDTTLKRLDLWLDRADPDLVTTGLIAWPHLATTTEPDELPIGPMQRSFATQQEGVVT